MASITKAAAWSGDSRFSLVLILNESYVSNGIENYSNVDYTVQLSSTSPYQTWTNYSENPLKVIINGATVVNKNTTYNLTNNTQTVASGTVRVGHDEDGSKSLLFSASFTDVSNGKGSASLSGSLVLTKIGRYATITSFSVAKRDETSVLYSFKADAACDYAWYSVDNGATWNDLPKTNIVSGLAANTTYQFKLRLRRTDSQLTTDSSAYPQSTYNYPHCINSPDFTIGDALTLDFYNPLGREFTVKGYAKSDGSQIFAGTTAGTSLTGFNVDDANGGAMAQYNSIPNAQSGAYKVVVSWDGKAMTRDAGNIYKIRGNEYPSINAFDYIDSNNVVVAVTGDNKQIVQGKSMLQARFHPATANYGAGEITNYKLECNGISTSGKQAGSYDIGIIDSARDVDLTLTAYDSRGLSASKTIAVKMVAYAIPKATVTLQRLNNYENETYLTVDGSVSSVLDKNTMLIQYRYKQSGGEYGSFTTIGDRVKQTLSLDKNNAYIFNVVVTDTFGGTFTGEYVLNKGVFPLFIDTVKNSVGINCFPKDENSLEVNGWNIFDFVNKYQKSHKQILLGSAGGLKISVDSVYGSDKIPIVVTGADNASYTPVHTIIQYRTDGAFEYINLGYECTVTRKDKYIHIDALQWSFFDVSVPMGSEITLSNSAL